MNYFLSLLFYNGQHPARNSSGWWKPTKPMNQMNEWRRTVTPKVGQVYKIAATDNTNRMAEEMQMNIWGMRAVIISEWFGKVVARVNIGRGKWTDSVVLNSDDFEPVK